MQQEEKKQAEKEKLRADLAENLKKKTLLSEKERIKGMIDKAETKVSDTTTSTSNKRVEMWGKQLTIVSLIDNSKAATSS